MKKALQLKRINKGTDLGFGKQAKSQKWIKILNLSQKKIKNLGKQLLLKIKNAVKKMQLQI